MEKQDPIKVSKNLTKQKADKTGKVQFDLTGKMVNPIKLDLSSYLKKKIEDKDE